MQQLEQSKCDRALEIFEEIVDKLQEHLGDSHVNTLCAMKSFGLCFLQQVDIVLYFWTHRPTCCQKNDVFALMACPWLDTFFFSFFFQSFLMTLFANLSGEFFFRFRPIILLFGNQLFE